MKNKIRELKIWDNETWLSSSSYINSFNTFLLKKKKLNKNSQILDIGCGRGKIFGDISKKLKLLHKPIGIDPIAHKDVDKYIDFKNEDVFDFFKTNKIKFDLIMIKQTLHFFNKNTGELFAPGIAPLINNKLFLLSISTISKFLTVTLSEPILPAILMPLKTLDGHDA